MPLEQNIIDEARANARNWQGEMDVLVSIMEGRSGTNAQRNTLRRIIRQNAAVLNQAEPALVFTALKKISEVSRITGLMGDARPKTKLGAFINQGL